MFRRDKETANRSWAGNTGFRPSNGSRDYERRRRRKDQIPPNPNPIKSSEDGSGATVTAEFDASGAKSESWVLLPTPNLGQRLKV